MNFTKKIWFPFIILCLVIVSACSGENNDPNTNSNNETVVEFWHSMGGNNLDIMEELIEKYNESQDDFVVDPIYQGSYTEGFSKLNSLLGTDEVPALMQLNEGSTKSMIDLGYIKPMHELIEDDDFDISDFEPAVLERYEFEGDLYSMPFNPSIAVVYYNKDAFKEAGLDPDNPPQTYSEYADAAEKLTIRDGDNVEQYGLNIRNFGWHFEQLSVNQGGFVVNNENSRDGDATETTLNSEELNKSFTWIKEMYDAGTFANLGRDNDDANDSFFSGNTAMYVHTSSVAVRTIDDADFEVGIAKYPVPDDIEPQGSVLGGASVWMFEDLPKEVEEGAWDFIKFLVDPETQAEWASRTGYFPVTQAVDETDTYQKFLEDYPETEVAREQLQISKGTNSNKGAFIGYYDDIWDNLAEAYEYIILEDMPVEKALDRANEKAQDGLDNYVETHGN